MTQTNLEQIKKIVVPILKEAGVTHSSLFGSYVHGGNTEESDIDMLVDYPKEKSLYDFIGLQLRLEDALHKKVDLITYSGIKPRLRERILNDQVQIL
jgi:predicted nucleotidyltransferase